VICSRYLSPRHAQVPADQDGVAEGVEVSRVADLVEAAAVHFKPENCGLDVGSFLIDQRCTPLPSFLHQKTHLGMSRLHIRRNTKLSQRI
jgi:hypothetical protein